MSDAVSDATLAVEERVDRVAAARAEAEHIIKNAKAEAQAIRDAATREATIQRNTFAAELKVREAEALKWFEEHEAKRIAIKVPLEQLRRDLAAMIERDKAHG